MCPLTPFASQATVHPPLPAREERESLFAKCFSRVHEGNMAAGWFFSTSHEHIKRENMVEWLLWAIFGTARADVREEWAEEIEGYVLKIERLLGRKLEQGWDEQIRCMKITLDPVHAVHRPLVWYFVSEIY